jgi:hypothetical protein
MWCLVESAKPSLHSNIFCGFLRTHVRSILIFQADLVSKLAQHASEESHKICWNEAKVLRIEPNTIYRKYKESIHTSLPSGRPLSQQRSKTTTPSSVDWVGKFILVPYGEFVSPVMTYILIVLWCYHHTCGVFIQSVRMKGVQNKIIISQKAFSIHIYGLHLYKGKLSKFFWVYNFSVNFRVGFLAGTTNSQTIFDLVSSCSKNIWCYSSQSVPYAGFQVL